MLGRRTGRFRGEVFEEGQSACGEVSDQAECVSRIKKCKKRHGPPHLILFSGLREGARPCRVRELPGPAVGLGDGCALCRESSGALRRDGPRFMPCAAHSTAKPEADSGSCRYPPSCRWSGAGSLLGHRHPPGSRKHRLPFCSGASSSRRDT